MTIFRCKPKLSKSASLLNEPTSIEGELREFVYLDEVSVRSLRASRVGALPSELRDMQSAVLAAEVSGTASASVPTVVKASIQSTLTSTRSGGTEILRKTIVQSDFKDLRDGELSRLRLGPAHQPSPEFREDLLNTQNQWIVRADGIERSALLELTVRLGAAGIFKIGAVFESLTTLLSRSKLDPTTAKTLQEMGPMNEMVQELLSGLVPIECTAVDYRVGEMDGATWLVHTAMLDHLPSLINTRPLVLVATTTTSLYWQDLRQLLFSDLEFDVLARITKSGLAKVWSPVKLADVLRTFSPVAADAVDNLDSLARRLMDGNAAKEISATTPLALAPTVERKLLAFAAIAIADEDFVLTEPALERIGEVASRYENALTVSDLHPAYDEVCDALLDVLGKDVPLANRAPMRAAVNATIVATDAASAPKTPEAPRAIVEAEVVAIY